MDNNWCGAEDGRIADQEDWDAFKKEVASTIRGMKKPTLQAVKEKVHALDINDVRHAAEIEGFHNLPWN